MYTDLAQKNPPTYYENTKFRNSITKKSYSGSLISHPSADVAAPVSRSGAPSAPFYQDSSVSQIRPVRDLSLAFRVHSKHCPASYSPFLRAPLSLASSASLASLIRVACLKVSPFLQRETRRLCWPRCFARDLPSHHPQSNSP